MEVDRNRLPEVAHYLVVGESRLRSETLQRWVDDLFYFLKSIQRRDEMRNSVWCVCMRLYV